MEEMGYPSEQDWPDMKIYPEFPTFQKNFRKKDFEGRSLKIWAHRNPFKNISSKAFYLVCVLSKEVFKFLYSCSLNNYCKK